MLERVRQWLARVLVGVEVNDLRAEAQRWQRKFELLEFWHMKQGRVLRGEREMREQLVGECDQLRTTMVAIQAQQKVLGDALAAQKPAGSQPPAMTIDRYRNASAMNVMYGHLVTLAEEMKIGVYRRGQMMLISHTPLTPEQEAKGWKLLDVPESVRLLQERARMTMGVWN